MEYAEVAVDAPVGASRTFSYHIPRHFPVEPGQLVWVPFGRRTLQGIVVELAPAPKVEATKDILEPVEPSPLLTPLAMQLGRWISRYYLAGLFDSLSLFLPPAFKAHVSSTITPGDAFSASSDALEGLPSLDQTSLGQNSLDQTRAALTALSLARKMPESEFAKALGKGGIRAVNRLVDRRLVRRNVALPHPGRFRYDCQVVVAEEPGRPAMAAEGLNERQFSLLAAASNGEQPLSLTTARKEFGPYAVDTLLERGLVGLEWTRAGSAQHSGSGAHRPGPALTAAQVRAVAGVIASIDDPERQPRSFLLHGVTGSGKTEVYLRAIERVVKQGGQAIFLVPEISLTPQTVERVSARFPGRVAVLHSQQKPAEKFNQWWGIRDGRYDVVVGPRSALFAPLPSLRLIVIDEEHEAAFKQQEGQPLYHTRTTALELGRLGGAVVVLGSATPDVESYHLAQQGRHGLLELPHRISPDDAARPMALAKTEVCDMREELRQGNRGIFSRSLESALRDCVGRGQQAILFLNRRGSAPFVQCRDCGYVVSCSGCAVSLTYHSGDGSGNGDGARDARLLCHLCNRRRRMPRSCRQCGGGRIRQLGIGTQRVAQEVTRMFPEAQVERWDMDASRSGDGPEEMMRRLTSGETQVLVGTQMVAKGLDVPNVTLVGVVLADIGINLPDFRAGERSFGLLCQVAGRAGRGSAPGRVIIQTYNPDHYAITAAANQDFAQLYRQEIAARREQGNPPFNRLVHLVCQDTNATACQRQANATAVLFRQMAAAQGLTDVEVVGPAPGIPQRVRGNFRWHITLRGRNLHRFLEGTTLSSAWTVDVDPVRVV